MNSLVKKLKGLTIEALAVKQTERKVMVLDSHYEGLFQSINKLAASMANAPIAMITFLNDQHVWVVPGADYSAIIQHTQKALFFNWAVAQDQYIEIPNTSLISHQDTHLLKIYDSNLKFYAGVPLKLPMGEVIGVLSVLDTSPNSMSEYQISMLSALADVVAKSLVFKHHLLSDSQ